MSEEIKKFCVICELPFTPQSNRQKTCLRPDCVKKNKSIVNREYQKIYRSLSPNYKFNKNEGLPHPKPKKKRIQTAMTFEEWNALSVAERWELMTWELMTWEQIGAACFKLRISYGKAQTMLMQGTLPEDFGRKVENIEGDGT